MNQVVRFFEVTGTEPLEDVVATSDGDASSI